MVALALIRGFNLNFWPLRSWKLVSQVGRVLVSLLLVESHGALLLFVLSLGCLDGLVVQLLREIDLSVVQGLAYEEAIGSFVNELTERAAGNAAFFLNLGLVLEVVLFLLVCVYEFDSRQVETIQEALVRTVLCHVQLLEAAGQSARRVNFVLDLFTLGVLDWVLSRPHDHRRQFGVRVSKDASVVVTHRLGRNGTLQKIPLVFRVSA